MKLKHIIIPIVTLCAIDSLRAIPMHFHNASVTSGGDQSFFNPAFSDSFPQHVGDPDPHPEVFIVNSESGMSVNTYKFLDTPEKAVLSGTQFLQNDIESVWSIRFHLESLPVRFDLKTELVSLGGGASIGAGIQNDPDDFFPKEWFTNVTTGILNSEFPYFFDFAVRHRGEGVSLSKFTLTLTPISVPELGSTLTLLGLAVGSLFGLRRIT